MATNDSLSVRAAIVNLCNACMGISILAKPFALAVSGWYGIISFALAGILITYIGVCLSDVSRELLVHKKSIMLTNTKTNYNSINTQVTDTVSKSTNISNKSAYQLISYKAMGNKGEIFSVIAFIIIIALVLSVFIIMIFEILTDIVNNISSITNIFIDPNLIFLFSFIIYIPTALILNWKQMEWISWMGNISVISIFVSLIGISIYSLYMFDYGPPPKQLLIARINDINSSNLAINVKRNMSIIEQLSFTFVLVLFGVSGGDIIPKLSASMKNKNDITLVVACSYILVSLFYGSVAAIGYWIYGEYSDVMILNSFYVWPGGYVVIIVFVLLMVNLWASFAIMLSIYGDMTEGLLKINQHMFGYRRTLRIIVLSIVFVFSFFLRDHLAFLVTLCTVLGLFGTLAGVVLPIMIYLCAFWKHETKQLSIISKIFHVLLLTLCVVIGIYVAYNGITNVL
eukprot:164543_1